MEERKALKSGIWYTVSNFVVKSIAFLTTPIFTRLLTTNDFGAYNNYLSWLSVITIFVTLNLDSTLISAKYDFKDEFDSYILSMISLSTISGLIWLIIVNVFGGWFEDILGIEHIYINVMLVYLLFLPVINMFQTRERYSFEYKKSVITSLLLAISTSFLSVLMVVLLQNKLAGRIFGAAIPTIVIGFILIFFFIYKGKRISIRFWTYAIPICLPYIPHLLSLTVLNTTDKIMIDKWCGNTATALYSLAYTCGTIINVLMISLNTAYAPWLGKKLSENNHEEIRRFSYIYILLFFLLAIGIILISPEILLVLGGEKYADSVYVLAPISMGCVCQFIYTMFVNVEQFKKKTVGMAFASITAALINLVLNCIFIPTYGYKAAAYTTLIGYICLLLIHMGLVKKMNLSEVYDYKFIYVVITSGLILTMCITKLYSLLMIRYIVIVIYFSILGVSVLKNRKRIINLFRK